MWDSYSATGVRFPACATTRMLARLGYTIYDLIYELYYTLTVSEDKLLLGWLFFKATEQGRGSRGWSNLTSLILRKPSTLYHNLDGGLPLDWRCPIEEVSITVVCQKQICILRGANHPKNHVHLIWKKIKKIKKKSKNHICNQKIKKGHVRICSSDLPLEYNAFLKL